MLGNVAATSAPTSPSIGSPAVNRRRTNEEETSSGAMSTKAMLADSSKGQGLRDLVTSRACRARPRPVAPNRGSRAARAKRQACEPCRRRRSGSALRWDCFHGCFSGYRPCRTGPGRSNSSVQTPKRRITLDSKTTHGQAMRGSRIPLGRLVWRYQDGRQQHLPELQLARGCPRQRKMAEMRRIEHARQDPDARTSSAHRACHRGLPRPWDSDARPRDADVASAFDEILNVHSSRRPIGPRA